MKTIEQLQEELIKIFNKHCTLINKGYSEYIIRDKKKFISELASLKSEQSESGNRPPIFPAPRREITNAKEFRQALEDINDRLTAEPQPEVKEVSAISVLCDVYGCKDIEELKKYFSQVDVSVAMMIESMEQYHREQMREELVKFALMINCNLPTKYLILDADIDEYLKDK